MSQKKPCLVTLHIVSWLRKLPLYPRLLLIFCSLLIFSTGSITLFNQAGYTRELENSAVQYRAVLVRNALYKLQQQKESLEDVLEPLLQNQTLLTALHATPTGTETASLQEDNHQTIEQILLTARKKNNGIRALLLIANGDVFSVSANSESAAGPVVRDMEAVYDSEIYRGALRAGGYPFWYDSAAETPHLFFEYPQSSFGITSCATLSYQVTDPDSHTPCGVLICCVSPQYFADALAEYSTQDGGNTFIIGENSMLEGISAGLSAPAFPADQSFLHQQIFAAPEGEFLYEIDGQKLLVSFCGESDFPLRVVNLTYRDWVLRPAERMGQINLLILAVIILAGAFGFYVTTVSIVYPVNRLIDTMKRAGEGNLDAVYRPVDRDEIGVLCWEFDRMVCDMKALIDRVYVSEAREKELELAEKEAQLDALQMQLNPHFLYNTLDLIRWECMYENDGESAASDMIEKFCVLLRMTLKGNQKTESIAASLQHAATYLDVVNFRYTHKIQLDTCLDFDAEAYEIPCLSLQPILENTVRHGFLNSDTANRNISIRGRLDPPGQTLTLCITDNGCGMEEQDLAALQKNLQQSTMEKTHIGLRNVNQRCKLYYGAQYGVRVESHPGAGTSVYVHIPARPTH